MSSSVSSSIGGNSSLGYDDLNYSLTSKGTTIQGELSSFFHVKALKKHRSMKVGRHPSSLKKDSELYHYAKLSNNRKSRIQRGHSFWNVIEEENIHESIPKIEEVKANRRSSSPTSVIHSKINFIKTSSMNKALSSYLSDAFNSDLQHLEMQVDFKNRNQIFFGMSFIIINYAQEILYVNKRDELRCKPLNQIESTDRVKFKMIDLLNPSNPKPLEYGDQIWLQVLDANESSENTLQHGQLLTSKLFDLPQHSLINFDVLNKREEKIEKKKREKDEHSNKMVGSPPGTGTNESSPNSLIHSKPSSPNNNLGIDKEYFSDDESTKVKSNGLVVDTSEQLKDTAVICGDLQLSRILEMRRTDITSLLEDKQLSDDQALRYVSKQAMLVGRWMVHSAQLEGKKASKATEETLDAHGEVIRKKTTRSMHNTGNVVVDEASTDNCVYSCSPIFVMQDLYCIGTKHAEEHKKWPPRSTMIINNSTRIDKEKIDTYRHAYQDSAAVKTTLAQRMFANGTTKLFDGDTEIDDAIYADGIVAGGIALNKKSLADSVNDPTAAASGNNNNPQQQQQNSTGVNKNDYDFGCLRKIVKRGFPYDYSVDRKCVWKLCLFEQFSDSHMKLSEKDKAAKKVMETATVMMKLSQLNREGARTHFHSHHHDQTLPPLQSGEAFSKNLREINFKVTQNLEEKYLQNRRLKESRLKDHFYRHIAEIKVMEEIDEGRSITTPNKLLKSPSYANSITSIETSSNITYDNSSFEPLSQVPNLMKKPQIRRQSYLISTLPNSKASISDTFSIYSNGSIDQILTSPFSPKQVTKIGNEMTPTASIKTVTYSTTTANNNNSNRTFFPNKSESLISSVDNINKVKENVKIPSYDVFHQSNPITIYDRLSEGEKVLAMHKSFHHVNNNIISTQAQQTELSNDLFNNSNTAAGSVMSERQRKQQQQMMLLQQQREKRSSITKPGVMNKLEKILAMDGHIQQVIHFKEQQDKLRNQEVFYGLESSGT